MGEFFWTIGEINRNLSLGSGAKLGRKASPRVSTCCCWSETGAWWDPQELCTTLLMSGTLSLTTGKIFGTFGTTPPEPACAVHWGTTGIFWVALNDALNAQVVLISGCHACLSVSAAIPGCHRYHLGFRRELSSYMHPGEAVSVRDKQKQGDSTATFLQLPPALCLASELLSLSLKGYSSFMRVRRSLTKTD